MRENVCLAASTEDRLYAVGSQSHVTLVDDRLARDVSVIPSKQRGCGLFICLFIFIYLFFVMPKQQNSTQNIKGTHTYSTEKKHYTEVKQ